jgi:parallel beta-helix repeat protein
MKNYNKTMYAFAALVVIVSFFSSCEEDLSYVGPTTEDSTKIVAQTPDSLKVTPAPVVPVTPVVTATIEKANYYISPNGNDGNPGTIDKPFKSLDKIIDVVKPGDLVYVRGGVYGPTTRSKGTGAYFTGKNGSLGKLIRFWAYPGEKPILDCKSITPVGGGVGMRFVVNFWHVKGIEVRNVYQGTSGTDNAGIAIKNCNNCIFEELVVHDNGGIGMAIGGKTSNNLILNCDLYKNYDKYTFNSSGVAYPGGNADGLHITVEKGTINTIKGCRFYENSDDGVDMWETDGIVKLDSCWAFNNGFDKGDGNGFKYGRTLEAYEEITKRFTSHCLSYNNQGMGFDQNNANAKMEFYNNFSYKNKGVGFYMIKYNLKNTFINNVSYKNGDPTMYITAESINKNNSWNGMELSDSDFIVSDMTGIKGARKANGNLPDVNFLVPSANSKVIDKGIDVGFPFFGKSPDLGIFEFKQ